jgi:hypothetical protein
MNDQPFPERVLEAVPILAFRLAKITKEWGPLDFPNDRGIETRNFLLIYGDSFTGLLEFQASPKSSDEWTKANLPHLAELNAEQTLRLIGLGCFHSQLLRWHGQFSTFSALVTPGVRESRVKIMEAWCNWIYSAFDLPSECASVWHEILTATDAMPRTEYYKRSVSSLKRYIEMLTPLGGTPAGDPEHWAGHGIWADFETRKQDAQWIAEASDNFMTAYGS